MYGYHFNARKDVTRVLDDIGCTMIYQKDVTRVVDDMGCIRIQLLYAEYMTQLLAPFGTCADLHG